MPRTAPTQTLEHRFTLGTFERQELAELTQVYKNQEMVDTGIKVGLTVAAGLSAWSLFTLGHSLGHWLMQGTGSVIGDVKDSPLYAYSSWWKGTVPNISWLWD